MAVAAAPATLDPRFATDAASTRIARLLFRAPVDLDERSRPVPALARWEAPSATCYRLTLGGQGREFHDGSRLTARDVAATYASVLDPGTGSPHRAGLAMVEHIATPDDDTVEFYLAHPDPLFPARLTLGVAPERLLAGGYPLGRRPVGSGPFALVDWPEEGRLILRRVADGEPFTFVRVPDPTMRALKLVAGEVDMLQGDLPPETLEWLARRPGLQVQQAPGTTFTYLGFNLDDPHTGQLAVRRAVASAIDRAAIARHLLRGTARPAVTLLPPEHWAGHPGLEGPAYDPERARRLLREAGYGPGRALRLALKTSSDPLRARVATVLQHQLGAVGVQASVQTFDWATFYADVKAGRFQAYLLSWVAVRTPEVFRYAFHSASLPPAGANRGRYRDPVADRLIERAEGAASEAQQAEHFRALQARLLETLPYVPLWYEDPAFVARRGLSGYRLTPDGGYDGLVGLRRER
jgi:peptide/nickel transport system substrate-binding protein